MTDKAFLELYLAVHVNSLIIGETYKLHMRCGGAELLVSTVYLNSIVSPGAP